MFEVRTKVEELLGLTVSKAHFLIEDLFDKYFDAIEPDIDKIRWEYNRLTTELNILHDYINLIDTELTKINELLKEKGETA